MIQLSEKRKTYSKMYFMTAVLHVLYWIIFMVEKCKPLAYINLFMIVFFLIIGFKSRGANGFKGIFMACSIAISFFIISHYVVLGPSYCFQYLAIGVVPLIFYLGYLNGLDVKMSKWFSIIIVIVFCIVSFICSNVAYPLVNIGLMSTRVIAVVNTVITFGMSIDFMSKFAHKTVLDKGILADKSSNLEEAANIDTLTGLRNRRTIDHYIERALYLARSEGDDFSILMCDIDNFKRVNDTYGHDCGDQVIVNIANIIKSETRPEDAVFRWGGEEILILIHAGGYVAKNVAERCRKSIEESVVEYKGNKIGVTITIGGVSYYQGATQEDLVKRADDNLYTGKNSGKNQVVM